MPGVARSQDLWVGICTCHPTPIPMSGPIITFSTDVNANGLGEARQTDIVIGQCGHTGVIISGSSTVFTNGLPSARCNDLVTGCAVGIIQTCSQDVINE